MKHLLLSIFVILLAGDASPGSDMAETTAQPSEAPRMAGTLVAEQTIQVGSKVSVEGDSPSTHFAVVFEDDGDTGYLYGLDLSKEENPIVDALQIYDVQAVTDRAL